MKKATSMLALILSVAIIACGQKMTVDDIVSEMTAAQGGAEALAAIEDQVSTWESTTMVPMGDSSMTMTGEMIITFKRPNKIKFESKMPDGTLMYASTFDGTTGWMAMMGQTREMTEAEIQESATMAATWIDGWLNYADKGMTLELLPDSTIDGKTYHVVQTTDKYGNTGLNFCNPENNMVERLVQEGTDPMTMEKKPYTMTFTDYAAHGGLMTPGVVRSLDADGNLMFESKLKELINNVGVSDDVFAMPEPPAGAEMSEK
jgi:outer membrane lipoprotein-sorting protein